VRIGGLAICFCVTVFAQQAAGPPAFEVASIKPSLEPPGSVVAISESKGGMSAKNVTLKRCIRGAYDIPESQVVGGPKWTDEDRYTIEAKTAAPSGDHELMLMLQTLLAESFKLVLHQEQRTIQGYRLAPAKGRIKAPASAPDSGSVGHSQRGRIDARGCNMAQLALKLAQVLQQPVVDATGIGGRFDLKLEWTPDEVRAKQTSDGPSIFTALQEQLGLKLEAAKVSAKVLVIDSAEKPAAN
jgi:uncharacterized protein (TIGR03435 family)